MAFIGIRIDWKVREKIFALTRELGKLEIKADWVHPDDYHITLKFLKNIPESTYLKLQDVTSNVLSEITDFSIEIGGVNWFSKGRNRRVFWIGITSGSEELREIATKIDAALAKAELAPSDANFVGHVTIARGKQVSPEVSSKLKKYAHWNAGKMDVKRVCFMKRRKKRELSVKFSPIYEPKFAIRLTPSS